MNNNGYYRTGDLILSRRLFPQGAAKPQPDFIPKALTEDYYEACVIREDSPKAAATLARRCLQGMIRDFCSIHRGTLAKEIDALRAAVLGHTAPEGVTMESVDAIDHVRTIGNIGAHMEKDINLIVPVDADEAQVLLDLVESLFEEWYVAAHRRRARFQRVADVAANKKALKAGAGSKAMPPADTEPG